MRPDTGSEVHLSPFRNPVPVPTVDPDASPTQSIAINCQWLAYIRGALLALTEQYTWVQDDPAAWNLAQARAMTLISMLTECSSPDIPFSCFYDFTLSDNGYYGFPISNIGYSPSPQGVYTSGVAWQQTISSIPGDSLNAVYILRDVDPTAVLTQISFDYKLVKGPIQGDTWISGVQLFDASYNLLVDLAHPYQTFNDATRATYAVSGSWTGISKVLLAMTCDAGNGIVGGQAEIYTAHIYGTGTPPCP